MLFNKNKDTPPEVSAVGLGKWYSELSDQNKVKLGRYLKCADTSSKFAFVMSVLDQAIADGNFGFAVTIGEMGKEAKFNNIQHYDINEKLVLAYYNSKKYDECLLACNEGLSMLPKLKKDIFARSGGEIPSDIYCRNYKMNVLVGIFFDYDEGDKALDEYFDMGLISKEDLEYRKQSNKIFKLQRTFDGIYAVKIKDGQ
ncbi:MAG: hypothetical protein KRP56_04755 [Candidatus Methanogranum gryphiswaldense]|nr:MAG: hypothetical protein KRP56_04755 [Candidatus Methanogranum sp. U3.2.1]